MNHSPAQILQKYLRDQGLATDPSDSGTWPAFIDHLPEENAETAPTVPGNSILVLNGPGRSDGRIHRTGELVEYPGIFIYVRSAAYATGWVQISSISDKVDATRRVAVSVDSDTYRIDSLLRVGPALPLGRDPDSKFFRHSFMIRLHATIKEVP